MDAPELDAADADTGADGMACSSAKVTVTWTFSLSSDLVDLLWHLGVSGTVEKTCGVRGHTDVSANVTDAALSVATFIVEAAEASLDEMSLEGERMRRLRRASSWSESGSVATESWRMTLPGVKISVAHAEP